MARDRERDRLRCIEYRKRKAAEEGRVYSPRVPAPPGNKRCTSCKAFKPLGEFHKNKRFNDGHGNQCKGCKRIEDRKRPNRQANRPHGHKRCYSCKAFKPLGEFYKNGSDRFARICSECQSNSRSRQREYFRKRYAVNREKILLKFKERDRNISESLSDSYIKKMITKGTSLKYKDVPQDLIEAWRLKVSIQRELKNLRRLQNA